MFLVNQPTYSFLMTYIQQRIHNRRWFRRDSRVLKPRSVASHLEFILYIKKSDKYIFGQHQVVYFRVIKGTLIFQENIDSTKETFGSSLLLSWNLCCIYFLDFPAVTFEFKSIFISGMLLPIKKNYYQASCLTSYKSCQASDSQNMNIHSTEEMPQVIPHWVSS